MNRIKVTALLLLIVFMTACGTRTIELQADDEIGPPITVPEESAPIQVPPTQTPDVVNPYPAPGEEGTDEQQSAPETVPEAATATPEPATGEDFVYTVVAGDFLGRIAEQFGVEVDDIAAANGLTAPYQLDVGDQLLIPLSGNIVPPTQAPDTAEATATPVVSSGDYFDYVVQPGDTLFRIGLNQGFTVDELASFNGLADPTRLDVGQVIRIPVR